MTMMNHQCLARDEGGEIKGDVGYLIEIKCSALLARATPLVIRQDRNLGDCHQDLAHK